MDDDDALETKVLFFRGRVNSLAIHPSGKIALSVSADKSAIVWNLMTARKASQNKLGQGISISCDI